MGTPSFGSGWEGRVVEGKFPLLEWRGGCDGYGSFFTVLGGLQQAVIHLTRASDFEAEAHLAQWNFAKDLSHPHIVKILAAGRCILDDMELVYVVTESSDASLSKIIRNGMLDEVRAKEIFTPILSALSYLHANGVVHGRINPSTIQFVGSRAKLCVSDLLIAGSVKRSVANHGLYDAPELQHGDVTAESDAWSVGMTMYEAMTDEPLSLDSAKNARAENAKSLPNTFCEIVQSCLRVDPERRCTVERALKELDGRETEQLSPRITVETEDFAAATTLVPMSEAKPSGESEVGWPPEAIVEESVIFSKSFERFEEAHLKRFRMLPYAVVSVAICAVIAVLMVRAHPIKSPSVAATENVVPAIAAPITENQNSSPAIDSSEKQSTIAASSDAHESGPEVKPQVAEKRAQEAPQPEPQNVAAPNQPAPKSTPDASREVLKEETNGSVVKRVLPNVSPGAFEGMRMIVEVQTRVSVDRRGTVSDVAYVSPGAGNYFARIAARSARSWEFSPPIQNGQPRSSVWMLRFFFARDKTEANAIRDQNQSASIQ